MLAGLVLQGAGQAVAVIFDHQLDQPVALIAGGNGDPRRAGGQGIGQQVEHRLVEGGINCNPPGRCGQAPLDRCTRPEQGGGFPQPGYPAGQFQHFQFGGAGLAGGG